VRKFAVVVPFLWLAGCQHAVQSNDAVRQAVMDTLTARGDLNLQAMDVKLDSVQYAGDRADATISFALKGNKDPMMRMVYHLEQKSGKWAVARADAAGHAGAVPPGAPNPHSGAAMPGAENPHGPAKMPSPDDLPPAGKKP
jgi:hypothetical protein